MSSSAPPLRIAILGCGRIGSAFAFQLARSGGHEVTVVGRPGSSRLAQLERDGGIVDSRGKRAIVQVTDRLNEAAAYDIIIVTVLAHQVEELLPGLGRSAAGCIQFMFNTFEPDRLRAAVGAERCALGMPFVQATLDGDGRLALTIGAGGQKSLMDQQRWIAVFTDAGLPAALEADMGLWLRCHTPMCVAFESISVAAARRGGGASWGEALALARSVKACFALIRLLGLPIYPRAKARLDRAPTWVAAAMLWTMSRLRAFRELLATGEAECRALVQAMVSAAPADAPGPLVASIAAMAPAEL